MLPRVAARGKSPLHDGLLNRIERLKVPQFHKLAELRSSGHTSTQVGYDFSTVFEGLVRRGEADVAIVSTEDGYSPLGISRQFFETQLGVSASEEIQPLASWNRSHNERVTLVAIPSQHPTSPLRGIILAPGSNTRSYERFASSYGRPHRDFYYNITYEAIAYACLKWQCKKLAISHLCGSGKFHSSMAICHAEALGHFCDEHPSAAPESFVFCGCCIDPSELSDIQILNAESGTTRHRPIKVETETRGSASLLHLEFD